MLPDQLPPCAVTILARDAWFPDPKVVSRTRLASANALARFLSHPRFSGIQIAAITLGHTIYFRRAEYYNPHTPRGLAFLAHEIKHVEQYEREGRARFYFKYFIDQRLDRAPQYNDDRWLGHGQGLSPMASSLLYQKKIPHRACGGRRPFV